jgi:hypothetical protein
LSDDGNGVLSADAVAGNAGCDDGEGTLLPANRLRSLETLPPPTLLLLLLLLAPAETELEKKRVAHDNTADDAVKDAPSRRGFPNFACSRMSDTCAHPRVEHAADN